MEFLLGLFVGFNFWLFAVFAVFLIFSFTSIHKESFAGTVGTLVFGVAAFWGVSALTDTTLPGLTALLSWKALLYYVLIGLGWTVFKWVLQVLRWKKAYNKAFAAFAAKNNLGNISPTSPLDAEQRKALRKHLSESYDYGRRYVGRLTEVPQASNNKERLGVWFVWWPFSVLWTVLGDGIVWVGKTVYNLLATLLRAINKAIIGGYDNNLKDE